MLPIAQPPPDLLNYLCKTEDLMEQQEPPSYEEEKDTLIIAV